MLGILYILKSLIEETWLNYFQKDKKLSYLIEFLNKWMERMLKIVCIFPNFLVLFLVPCLGRNQSFFYAKALCECHQKNAIMTWTNETKLRILLLVLSVSIFGSPLE